MHRISRPTATYVPGPGARGSRHDMDELFQAEWCPHSSRVRQRFTELGVSFIARPVPAEPIDREEMRRKTGTDEIPALLLEDGTAVTGGAEPIIAHLNEHFGERDDAAAHRGRADQ
jgi:glutathione S-transferase